MSQQAVPLIVSEKVKLFTDRSLYISGEKLHFTAFVETDHSIQPEMSQILYVEIISPDGKSLVGSKFPINNYSASGCLKIPEDIVTGYYYARAYTKYMRNQGPGSYAYLGIKIINPLNENVLEGNDILLKNSEASAGDENTILTIVSDKNEYAPHEKVNVSVKFHNTDQTGDLSNKINNHTIISVVPESSFTHYVIPLTAEEKSIKETLFVPETRGTSVTGALIDNGSGKTVAGARINLSIIGQGRDFMATQTDSAGRFFFSLPPYSGYRDLFICTDALDSSQTHLLVDNDFCSVPVHLPHPEFILTDDERKTALQMAVNIRVNKHFESDSLKCSDPIGSTDKPFYGKPSDIIVLDDYVQLPTLEEYFNELNASVNVKKRHGKSYFKVLGTQPEMNYYEPLVLVDLVAVNDPSKILAASPSAIDRIEIINVPYVKGDITYGGIVSIISKKGDFAGIDLPSSGIFINYLFLADTCHCNIIEPVANNLPDARNTLYWNPNLELNAEGSRVFSFTTPDTPGRYEIVATGINNEGNPVSQWLEFIVKKVE